MPIQIGAIAPWLDNYPIYRQLWASNNHTPGNELKLVPLNRNLTVQLRAAGNVVFANSELQSTTYISVVDSDRGVIKIQLSGAAWQALQPDQTYLCEVIAYGFLYDSFELSTGLPNPYFENLNGVEVYASPREALEVMGPIPGASLQTSISLTGGWTLNAERYWTKTLTPNQPLFGLWIDDLHVVETSYDALALGAYRQYARVGDTLYYKGPEDLASPHVFVETGHNVYVLRSLREASREIDRKTGQSFDKRRIYRELHRVTYRMHQLSARMHPVHIDQYFRLDCYSRSRSPRRRYTETSLSFSTPLFGSGESSLFADSETGIFTLTDHFWDWLSWDDTYTRGFRAFSYFPPGDVSLELTYTAGYEKVPVDISEAAGNLAAIRLGTFWQQALTQGMSGLSIGCVNMNFGSMMRDWLPSWQQAADSICSNYQRFEIEAF